MAQLLSERPSSRSSSEVASLRTRCIASCNQSADRRPIAPTEYATTLTENHAPTPDSALYTGLFGHQANMQEPVAGTQDDIEACCPHIPDGSIVHGSGVHCCAVPKKSHSQVTILRKLDVSASALRPCNFLPVHEMKAGVNIVASDHSDWPCDEHATSQQADPALHMPSRCQLASFALSDGEEKTRRLTRRALACNRSGSADTICFTNRPPSRLRGSLAHSAEPFRLRQLVTPRGSQECSHSRSTPALATVEQCPGDSAHMQCLGSDELGCSSSRSTSPVRQAVSHVTGGTILTGALTSIFWPSRALTPQPAISSQSSEQSSLSPCESLRSAVVSHVETQPLRHSLTELLHARRPTSEMVLPQRSLLAYLFGPQIDDSTTPDDSATRAATDLSPLERYAAAQGIVHERGNAEASCAMEMHAALAATLTSHPLNYQVMDQSSIDLSPLTLPSVHQASVESCHGSRQSSSQAPVVSLASSPQKDVELLIGLLEGSVQDVPSTTSAIRSSVPDHALLHLVQLLNDDSELAQHLRDFRMSPAIGEIDSLLGGAPDDIDGRWEPMLREQDLSLQISYTAEKRPLRGGLFVYRTRTVFQAATAAQLRSFNLNDELSLTWNFNTTTFEHLPAPHESQDSPQLHCTMACNSCSASQDTAESAYLYMRCRFPMAMASREYVSCRRVWHRQVDGGCCVVNVACNNPHATRKHGKRAVRVQDYVSGYIIRERELEGDLVAELHSIYFESSGVAPFIANVAVHKGLWAAVQTHAKHFRHFQEVKSYNQQAEGQAHHASSAGMLQSCQSRSCKQASRLLCFVRSCALVLGGVGLKSWHDASLRPQLKLDGAHQ